MQTTTNLHSATLHINVKPRLEELIKQAECLQMAVAYWTIPENYFGNNLIELLKKEDSFACVDISTPTNIDEICKLADKTGNLYFYTKSLVRDTSTEKSESKNLLHSKILLFDLPNNLASIWIGSHNWTDRALLGKNIETSLELSLDRNSDIYKEVKVLLSRIKSDCHRIIPNSKRIYDNTQRKENSLLYLHSNIREDQEIPLTSKPFIHLILDDNKPDSKSFPFGKEIAFLMNCLNSNKQFLLVGKVFNSGGLPKLGKKSNWPNFENGYYCLRQNNRFTNFIPKPEHKEFINGIINFCYYATLEITDVEEIHDINSQVFSKYETPITLLNKLTQLEFYEFGWQQSESFKRKCVRILDTIRMSEEDIWMNKILDTDNYTIDKRYDTDFLSDSEIEAVLKKISLSKKEILIKEQLVNETDIENKISRIPREFIWKIIKKKY